MGRFFTDLERERFIKIERGLLAPTPSARRRSRRTLVAEAQPDSENNDEKRKARYQADSADVKAFYRVNNYPK
jgi:hypothetical protein